MLFGRSTRIYTHASAFTSSGLVVVAHTKNVKWNDEAQDMVASCPDLASNVHEPGARNQSLTFDILKEGTDAASFATLQDAYVAGTALYYAVCPKAKGTAGGKAMLFIGKVLKFDQDHPDDSPTAASIVVSPCDDTTMPTWTATPLS